MTMMPNMIKHSSIYTSIHNARKMIMRDCLDAAFRSGPCFYKLTMTIILLHC